MKSNTQWPVPPELPVSRPFARSLPDSSDTVTEALGDMSVYPPEPAHLNSEGRPAVVVLPVRVRVPVISNVSGPLAVCISAIDPAAMPARSVAAPMPAANPIQNLLFDARVGVASGSPAGSYGRGASSIGVVTAISWFGGSDCPMVKPSGPIDPYLT